MAFMRTRVAILKAAHHAKLSVHTAVQAVDRTVDRVHRAAEKTAPVVDTVHGYARPVYNFARPLLHHHGIDTTIADRALSNYDAIRRGVINGRGS